VPLIELRALLVERPLGSDERKDRDSKHLLVGVL
jgi:hypothetical protein